jgi:8-oxo-dGTP diphosphatase
VTHSAKQIAVAVVEHEDQFLIGQRPPGVPLAGLWEFPGGKIEPGETADAAAIRECREETDLEVQADKTLLLHEEHYPHGTVALHFIACRLTFPATAPRPPFRWVMRTDLAGYEFPAGNRELLGLLMSRG